MPHALTENITIENATRIIAARPDVDDDAGVMTIPLELRTAGATNYLIARRVVQVRNAPELSDRVVRVATPAVGSSIDAKLGIERNALTLSGGFDTALAAWAGGGGTATGKRNALEDALAALGVIDPVTLAGS